MYFCHNEQEKNMMNISSRMSWVFSNEAEEAKFLLSKTLECLQIVAFFFGQR